MKTIWIIIIIAVLLGLGLIFFINPENNNFGNMSDNGTDNESNESGNESEDMIQTFDVIIENFTYMPSTITINEGDTVIWTNYDSVGHTVTGNTSSELDSELLSQNSSYSHTFTDTGTYNYYCEPHPYMRGTVIVQ